jgi:uncharacterized lipoprotein YajG
MLETSKNHALLATCFMLDSCWAYSLTLKMEATYSSETSDDFQQATVHYTSEDKTPPKHILSLFFLDAF